VLRIRDAVKWFGGPWGQMVIYLLVFLVLGFGVTAFFKWVRGPERSPYTPWDADTRPSLMRPYTK